MQSWKADIRHNISQTQTLQLNANVSAECLNRQLLFTIHHNSRTIICLTFASHVILKILLPQRSWKMLTDMHPFRSYSGRPSFLFPNHTLQFLLQMPQMTHTARSLQWSFFVLWGLLLVVYGWRPSAVQSHGHFGWILSTPKIYVFCCLWFGTQLLCLIGWISVRRPS